MKNLLHHEQIHVPNDFLLFFISRRFESSEEFRLTTLLSLFFRGGGTRQDCNTYVVVTTPPFTRTFGWSAFVEAKKINKNKFQIIYLINEIIELTFTCNFRRTSIDFMRSSTTARSISSRTSTR